jgi:mRNA interferase RelE/StbE
MVCSVDKISSAYYDVYMINYLEEIQKRIKKGILPKEIFIHFNNAFSSIDMTKDLRLFDIKQLKQSEEKARVYYRLRKGKYRAIFYIEKDDIFVITIDKREEVYKKWL